MISSISNFKNLKKAKSIVKDLESCNKIIDITHRALAPYRKYVPINDILGTLRNNQLLVDLYIKKYKKIVEDKGIENAKKD